MHPRGPVGVLDLQAPPSGCHELDNAPEGRLKGSVDGVVILVVCVAVVVTLPLYAGIIQLDEVAACIERRQLIGA